MAATTFSINAGEYGSRIRVRTHNSDVATGSAFRILFKKRGATDTATLTAALVAGDTDYYAIQASLASGWSDDLAGEWVGQAEITWASAKSYGDTFTMVVNEVAAL